MKRFLIKIYTWWRSYKLRKKIISLSKSVLNEGVYYFDFNKKEISKTNDNSKKKFKVYGCKKKRNELFPKKYSYLKFDYGMEKIVILSQDFVYAFFNKRESYKISKDSFVAYYKLFNYPCVQGLNYADSKKCLIMNKVEGEVKISYHYDISLIESLCKYLLNAHTIINMKNEVLFLQHGDVKRENVLWDKKEHCFIDLDCLGYFPPFFDVLHYLEYAKYSLKDIISFLQYNYEVLIEICKRANINTEQNCLDEIFYKYLLLYKENSLCLEDIKVFKSEEIKDFPKSFEIVCAIFNFD